METLPTKGPAQALVLLSLVNCTQVARADVLVVKGNSGQCVNSPKRGDGQADALGGRSKRHCEVGCIGRGRQIRCTEKMSICPREWTQRCAHMKELGLSHEAVIGKGELGDPR